MGLLDQYFDPEMMAAVKSMNQLSEEDKIRARNAALGQMGFAMLANNRGQSSGQAMGNALGHGGMAFNQAYQGTLDEAKQNQMQQFQMAGSLQKMQQEQAKRQRIMEFRNGLPEQDRGIFDMAPDKYIENMPRFQKQQLVEVADPNEPLRTQKQWMRPGETSGVVAGVGAMPEILDPRVQSAKRSIAAAGRSVQSTNVFNNTKDDFKNERDLRNDFAGLPTTKAFKETQSAYDQIKVAIKKESPAGDLAAATKIMKILDPGSVVRESELGMAMAATGAMDRVSNYADMVIKGTKLTPSQRKDFGELSAQLYGAAADRYNKSADEYQGVAKDYNLNSDRVAKKAQTEAQQRTVVRRGRYNGKTVVEYSDGTVDYAN